MSTQGAVGRAVAPSSRRFPVSLISWVNLRAALIALALLLLIVLVVNAPDYVPR